MSKRAPTVVHLSWLKRADGELGGVEKFAEYLKAALAERGWDVAIISWRDYPRWKNYEELSNPDKALLLGKWLDGPLFGFAFDLVVSDGYWGIGVSSKPVVPVVHGTWAEMHARMGMAPGLEVQRQGEAFNAANAFPVACSPASAREVRRHHGRTVVATIPHGIDLRAYRPAVEPPLGPPWVVLEAAGRNAKKGARLMPHVQRFLGDDHRIEFLAAGRGEEPEAFRRGHVFLHPTRHEGNAYACLEAAATDLPIITTQAGLFEDVPWDREGRTEAGYTLPLSATPEQLAGAVRRACHEAERGFWRGRPRAWAERNANMTAFAEAWDGLLREVLGKEATP